MRRGWAFVWASGLGLSGIAGAAVVSAQVETAWVCHYTGSGQGGSVPDAIAADSDGNVYVTGRSWNGSDFDQVLLMYSPEGCLEWERHYIGPAGFGGDATTLSIDRTGDICITGANAYGGTHHGYCVVRYDTDGCLLTEDWRNWPEAGPTHITGIQPDGAGGVFVIGRRMITPSDSSDATMRFSGTGRLLWAEPFGITRGASHATALQADGAGNVYVTGDVKDRAGSGFLTIKYNSNGDLLWKDRFHTSPNLTTVPHVIRVNDDGQVWVSGCSRGHGPDCDIVLLKYTPEGRPEWSRVFSTSGRSPDRVSAMETDHQGNVYIAGFSREVAADFDYVTLKYSPRGELLWTERYNGPSDSRDQAHALVVDQNGNTYVTGSSWLNGLGYSLVTLKYRIGDAHTR